ncbi:hypothetical protein GCM10012284_04250 [Mangrovihabitans endophyticus]|uniref:Uncharacterized protein n=2 Tax=Mangrovihabitans endophyticus TaxID=1751298 RepID=A0A8J3FLM9_9ACTN|nr:hypothetical protein GCM10012284_04250 [Mangrovihabitans endophyticus]
MAGVVVAGVVEVVPSDRNDAALAGLAVGLSAFALIGTALVLLAARRAERIAIELALYHLDQGRRAAAVAEDLRDEMERLHTDLARIAAHADIAGQPGRRSNGPMLGR